MPSPEQFTAINSSTEFSEFAAGQWEQLAKRNSLQALLVIRHNFDTDNKSCKVQWSFNLPAEPFNGAENEHLRKAIDHCFLIHPKPHVHALKHDTFADTIHHLNKNLKEQYRMWFFPISIGSSYYTFLGFPDPETGRAIPKTLLDDLSGIFVTLDGSIRASELFSRLEVTERYVKEVGHDIASSVQATLAKLRNISDGLVTGNSIKFKTKEIEAEVWSLYQIAEALDIVVDPDYQVRAPKDFNLNEAIRTVLKHFKSEASERNLSLRFEQSEPTVNIWGDRIGIQQVISQLISNAIKYSLAGSEITIISAERADDLFFTISNRGWPLPPGPDSKRIWDFGYRGKIAKERHVNGSGIGLYTVKKIVSAHHGWVSADHQSGITHFSVHLPKKASLRKELGVLL